MYTGHLTLTNPKKVPMSLSNLFEDCYLLEDVVRNSKSAEAFCNEVNAQKNRNKVWTLDADYEDVTRLRSEDSFGNVSYLLAEKKSYNKHTVMSVECLAEELLARLCFLHWKEPTMAKLVKLSLEYLAAGNTKRVDMIREEVNRLIHSEFVD